MVVEKLWKRAGILFFIDVEPMDPTLNRVITLTME